MRDDAAGVNYGGSDPRKDGAAIPEPFPTDLIGWQGSCYPI